MIPSKISCAVLKIFANLNCEGNLIVKIKPIVELLKTLNKKTLINSRTPFSNVIKYIELSMQIYRRGATNTNIIKTKVTLFICLFVCYDFTPKPLSRF